MVVVVDPGDRNADSKATGTGKLGVFLLTLVVTLLIAVFVNMMI
jgi:hypothetical protein